MSKRNFEIFALGMSMFNLYLFQNDLFQRYMVYEKLTLL